MKSTAVKCISNGIAKVAVSGIVINDKMSDCGCLFVAKFNDWLSCVQHIDLNTFNNNIMLF